MKGKYKNAAERRRAITELTGTAMAAEKQATEMHRKLEDTQQASTARITSLSSEVRRLRSERDAAAAPALSAAEQRIRDLMKELDEARTETRQVKDLWRKLITNAFDMFCMLGFTRTEAVEAATVMLVPHDDNRLIMIADTLAGVQKTAGLERADAIAIAAARGKRNKTDVVEQMHSAMQAWREASATTGRVQADALTGRGKSWITAETIRSPSCHVNDGLIQWRDDRSRFDRMPDHRTRKCRTNVSACELPVN